MAPNPRVLKAFRAMKDLEIDDKKVKPVLKKLLKLYDKKWELIEEDNYRVLIDAIFDAEEPQVHFFSLIRLIFLYDISFSCSFFFFSFQINQAPEENGDATVSSLLLFL